MKNRLTTVKVKFSVQPNKNYSVFIGTDIIDQVAFAIKKASKANKVLLVSDNRVFSLFGNELIRQLSAHFEVHHLLFPAGEKSKNLRNLYKIWEQATACDLHRADAIIAFGGGVIGDLAGFAASTYMRGIDFIQIPTSLLAMVDAAIGGKTAINLPAGKNLTGTFHQPKLVFADLAFLEALPPSEIKNGFGEIIKYAFSENSIRKTAPQQSLFDILSADEAPLANIITRCCNLKADVISHDETEQGLRTLLNFGHTFAHALEKASHYRTLKHGQAVVLGMQTAFNLSFAQGLISEDYLNSFNFLLDKWGLRKPLPSSFNATAPELYTTMLIDKKNKNGKINFVLPLPEHKLAVYDDLHRDAVIKALNALFIR